MSELLLTRPIGGVYYNRPEGEQLIESVFRGDKTVSHIRSTKRTGESPSGKSWTSFRTNSIETFSWRNGPVRVYTRTRQYTGGGRRGRRSFLGPLRDHTSETLRGLVHPLTRDQEGILAEAGVPILDQIRADYPMQEYFSFAPVVTPLLAANNHVELSRRVLGKRYQRSVPRALVGLDEHVRRGMSKESVTAALQAVILFQGIMPTDWLPGIIDSTPDWRYVTDSEFFDRREELRAMRRLLRTATEPQLRRIATRELDVLPRMIDELRRDQKYLRDYHNAELNLSDYTFTSLSNLHEQLNAPREAARREAARRWAATDPVDQIDWEARRAQREAEAVERAKNTVIEYEDEAKDFAKEYDEFSVIAPANGAELMEWSDYMNNCIRSYGTQAAEGQTLLYGVKQGEKMVANMELDPRTGNVKQLLGRFNQSLDTDLSEKIKQVVLQTWPNATVNEGWQ